MSSRQMPESRLLRRVVAKLADAFQHRLTRRRESGDWGVDGTAHCGLDNGRRDVLLVDASPWPHRTKLSFGRIANDLKSVCSRAGAPTQARPRMATCALSTVFWQGLCGGVYDLGLVATVRDMGTEVFRQLRAAGPASSFAGTLRSITFGGYLRAVWVAMRHSLRRLILTTTTTTPPSEAAHRAALLKSLASTDLVLPALFAQFADAGVDMWTVLTSLQDLSKSAASNPKKHLDGLVHVLLYEPYVLVWQYGQVVGGTNTRKALGAVASAVEGQTLEPPAASGFASWRELLDAGKRLWWSRTYEWFAEVDAAWTRRWVCERAYEPRQLAWGKFVAELHSLTDRSLRAAAGGPLRRVRAVMPTPRSLFGGTRTGKPPPRCLSFQHVAFLVRAYGVQPGAEPLAQSAQKVQSALFSLREFLRGGVDSDLLCRPRAAKWPPKHALAVLNLDLPGLVAFSVEQTLLNKATFVKGAVSSKRTTLEDKLRARMTKPKERCAFAFQVLSRYGITLLPVELGFKNAARFGRVSLPGLDKTGVLHRLILEALVRRFVLADACHRAAGAQACARAQWQCVCGTNLKAARHLSFLELLSADPLLEDVPADASGCADALNERVQSLSAQCANTLEGCRGKAWFGQQYVAQLAGRLSALTGMADDRAVALIHLWPCLRTRAGALAADVSDAASCLERRFGKKKRAPDSEAQTRSAPPAKRARTEDSLSQLILDALGS